MLRYMVCVCGQCANPESFVRGAPTLPTFVFCFLDNDGSEDPNNTKIGPSSARQRNATKMALRWRYDKGPTLKAGLVAL